MPPNVTDRGTWSVDLSVYHTSKPSKNGCTDQDAVYVEDSGGPSEPCIRWEGARFPIGRDNFEGRGKGCPIAKYMETLRSSVQKQLNRSRCLWVVGSDKPKESYVRWEFRGAEGYCHGNQFWDTICYNCFFWLSMGYNFGCMIASDDRSFNSRGGFSVTRYSIKT